MTYRSLPIIILAVGLALVVGACTKLTDPALESRAGAYLLVANNTEEARPFYTPRIQEYLQPGGSSGSMIAFPTVPPEIQSASNEELSRIAGGDLIVRTIGKWGRVRFRMETSTGMRDFDTVWIRAEGEWYLFGGTDGELSEYGKPPVFVD